MNSNRGIALDFESFFDTKSGYTLKKMTTEAYVRDQRFATICMGYDLGDGQRGWVKPSEIRQFLSQFQWDETTVVCHNAIFDGSILSHHYSIYPHQFMCTLSMARALYPDGSLSLDALASKFDLGVKSVPYHKMDGVHPDNISEELLAECGTGAADDCCITVRLLKRLLADGFPRAELPIIDMTVQMFTNPRLVGDVGMLKQLQQAELAKRETMLGRLGVTAEDMGSPIKFRELLEAHGVEIAMKEGKRGPIPAFAATDPFMQELAESDEETVAALAEARIAVKSNIRGTRAARLADTAGRGSLPVCLKYFGATRTSRWSGADRSNWQNFPRTGELGKCVSAQRGFMLVIADASQIEYRLLCAVAGEKWPLEAFRAKRDLYCEMAASIFQRPVVKADKFERFFGKKTTLASGYGIGWLTLFKRLKGEGGELTEGITEELCQQAVGTYRGRHPHVVGMWDEADLVLRRLYLLREEEPWRNGILRIDQGSIILPNNTKLQYSLRREEGNYVRTDRRGSTKIWGSALTGEVIQALASVFLRDVLINIHKVTRLKPVCLRHDEIVYCVPEQQVDHIKAAVEQAFCTPPIWLPEIPLECECWNSKTYTKVGG